MLAQIKSYVLPSMGTLHWLAAKYIFDKANFTKEDGAVMDAGLERWPLKVGLTDDDRWQLTRIANALIANDRGHFERAKELFKQHNVDYKKFYSDGLPYIPEPNKVRTFGRM